jgi:hypothetical protein
METILSSAPHEHSRVSTSKTFLSNSRFPASTGGPANTEKPVEHPACGGCTHESRLCKKFSERRSADKSQEVPSVAAHRLPLPQDAEDPRMRVARVVQKVSVKASFAAKIWRIRQ